MASSNVNLRTIDNNPPCYEAKQEYVKKLKAGSSHFLNTATHSKLGSISQPIVFKINENGKTLRENATVLELLQYQIPHHVPAYERIQS